jgi:toxin ParE1/3/4
MEGAIIWSADALQDLSDIYQYVRKDSKFYADRLVDEIYLRVTAIIDQPLIGRIVPEKADPLIREVFKGNYRIIYSLQNPSALTIYRIIHRSRDYK